MLLNHVSNVIDKFRIFMPHTFLDNIRRIRLFGQFFNIFIEFIFKLYVPLMQEVNLIIDNYAESLGMSSISNNWLYSVNEL